MQQGAKRTNQPPSSRILGIDLSSNHAAFVCLNEGKLEDYTIVTDTQSIADCAGDDAIVIDVDSTDAAERSLMRLEWWSNAMGTILGMFHDVAYVAIEDYAYGAKQGAHQLGEIGGILRLALWKTGWKIRKYTPGQIKKFAAHKGRAEKDEMVACVQERWGQDWSFLRPVKKGKPTKLWTSAEDAADAFSCAKLLDTEIQLRRGMLKLDMLHEREIEVFNTVSKKGDVNLLAQEFIQKAA